jgi:ribosomal protein S18 acetylase RimI-like enzyme
MMDSAIDTIQSFHRRLAEKTGLPFDGSIVANGGIAENGAFACVLGKPPNLQDLRFPTIRLLSFAGDTGNPAFDADDMLEALVEIDRPLLAMVEDHNTRAISALKYMNARKTYFHQRKLLNRNPVATAASLPETTIAGIKIRKFSPGRDERLYANLYNETLGFLGARITSEFVEEIERRPSFDPGGYFIAETLNAIPAGFAALERSPWGDDTTFGYIYQIGVTTEHMGSGLASSLLRSTLYFASKRGVELVGTGVRNTNKRALEFFGKHGFRDSHGVQGFILET